MTDATSTAAAALVRAIVARDLTAARALLHPRIDFRGMTPNRIWEADAPAGVEDVLRAWLDDPRETITAIEATEPAAVEDTTRVGWRVCGSTDTGEFVYEQQAYLREDAGRITWLRVICSGQRPLTP